MPTQAEIDRWHLEHPAPFRPPNVGSEEREKWKDEVGEPEAIRLMKQWQDWWNLENEFQSNAISEAYGHEDWESALRKLGYEDRPEHGASVFAKFRALNDDARAKGYKDWQDMRGKQSWNSVRDTHYGFDQPSGLWVNPGNAAEGDWNAWDWRDNEGNRVGAPNRSAFYNNLTSSSSAGGGTTTPGYNAATYDRAPGQPGAYGVSRPPSNVNSMSKPKTSAVGGGSYGNSVGFIPYPTVNSQQQAPKQERDPWQWI